MPRTRVQFRLFDLVMWVSRSAVLGFARELTRMPRPESLLPLPIILLGLAFGVWYMIWTTVRAKRAGPVCEQCGRRFNPRGQPANTTLCPQCRYRSLPRGQARRQQLVGWLIILIGLTFLMALICLPFWNPLVARVGLLSWILYPLLNFGATLSLLLAVFAVMAIFIVIRNWRLRFDKPALFPGPEECPRRRNNCADRHINHLVVRHHGSRSARDRADGSNAPEFRATGRSTGRCAGVARAGLPRAACVQRVSRTNRR